MSSDWRLRYPSHNLALTLTGASCPLQPGHRRCTPWTSSSPPPRHAPSGACAGAGRATTSASTRASGARSSSCERAGGRSPSPPWTPTGPSTRPSACGPGSPRKTGRRCGDRAAAGAPRGPATPTRRSSSGLRTRRRPPIRVRRAEAARRTGGRRDAAGLRLADVGRALARLALGEDPVERAARVGEDLLGLGDLFVGARVGHLHDRRADLEGEVAELEDAGADAAGDGVPRRRQALAVLLDVALALGRQAEAALAVGL